MSVYVLLTDDDTTLLVRCEDMQEAEHLGTAAVWGTDSVSAWLVPSEAVTDAQAVTVALADRRLDEINDLPRIPVTTHLA